MRTEGCLNRNPYGIGRLGGWKMVQKRHPESNLFALSPAAFAPRQVQFDALRRLGGEFAIDMSRQLTRNVPPEHSYPFVPIRLFNPSASILWARLKRDATVPMEQWRICAICS